MNNVSPIQKSLYQKYCDIMPTGAGALFFIQMFATLAFSVLYSTLVLYTTNRLHLPDVTATSITASFVAFNYALHLLGGFIGGRLLSYRSLFSIGMSSQVIGCILISIPTTTSLYWGLAVFLTGAGLNVTCINCMLTQLFQPNDKRREAAFLWNYSGMNVGFFVGFSVSGYFQLHNSYQTLFLFASIGNLIALIITSVKWQLLNDANTVYMRLSDNEKRIAKYKGIGLIVLLMFSLRLLLKHAYFSNNLIMLAGAAMGGLIIYLATQQSEAAQKKLWAFLILALMSLVFWTLYQLAPMGLTFFIERNVDRHYFGTLIAPQWVQNINTVVIILGGPLLSVLFSALRDRGIALTIPLQFSIALFLIGISMAILPIGIHFANANGFVNFNWILMCYILQSAGELFISPIGYAMVGQLAPQHLQGMLMGTWLMITGVAATLSGYFTNMALGDSTTTNPLVTNANFSHTFGLLGWSAIATGVLLLILTPYILKLMQERKTEEDAPVTLAEKIPA